MKIGEKPVDSVQETETLSASQFESIHRIGTLHRVQSTALLADVTEAENALWVPPFGPQQWKETYGATEEDLDGAPLCPCTAEMLRTPCPFYPQKTIGETHGLFLGLHTLQGQPLTINAWYEMLKDDFHFDPHPWYTNKDFASKITAGLQWCLVLLKPVPNSTKKKQWEQQFLLPRGYQVPSAIIEQTKNILFTDYVRPHPRAQIRSRWVRCRDTTSDGKIVNIGFADTLMDVDYCSDWADERIGLSAIRTLENCPNWNYSI